MTALYWFDGSSADDPIDRAYPLRALNDAEHTAPIDATETDIVEKIRNGDSTAFETLYRAHASGLIGFAYRLCGDRAAAQDVVADVFTAVWNRRSEWNPQSGLRAYLYAAIRHRVIDRQRAETRASVRALRFVRDTSCDQPSQLHGETLEEPDDRIAVIWRVVDTFPVLRRQVMYLRWARELTPQEIAVALGLSRGAVDQHLSRAVAVLRRAMRADSGHRE